MRKCGLCAAAQIGPAASRVLVKMVEFIQEFAKFLTTLFCGLFAGAAIYVNLVEHPARMECGPELAATEFGPSYPRATVMQA
jgi:hypothetical protein